MGYKFLLLYFEMHFFFKWIKNFLKRNWVEIFWDLGLEKIQSQKWTCDIASTYFDTLSLYEMYFLKIFNKT